VNPYADKINKADIISGNDSVYQYKAALCRQNRFSLTLIMSQKIKGSLPFGVSLFNQLWKEFLNSSQR